MALNSTIMCQQVISAIESATGNTIPPGSQAVWQAVCNAIVAHIVNNAQVVVASVSGVTTGPGVSGPGTGTVV
jgi:hypothetical protein